MADLDLNGYAQRYSTIIQTVTVVGLFVAGFWAAVISPMQGHIDKFDHAYLAIREHDEFKFRIDQRLKDVVDGQISLIISDIIKLKDQQVTRAEHIQHWNESAERFNALTARLNELQKDFNGSYNLGDQIKNLQKQLDDLRLSNAVGHLGPVK
jgi:hypothetical protein